MPNITEAALLTGLPYREAGYDESYILALMNGLRALGAGAVVMTGVSYREGEIGVAVIEKGQETPTCYFHEKLPENSHGTGDIFASAFTGARMRGLSMADAARIAADFTVAGMKATIGDPAHRYGTKFEKAIPALIAALDAATAEPASH